MTGFSARVARGTLALPLLAATLAAGCVPAQPGSGDVAADAASTRCRKDDSAPAKRDRFVGWYSVSGKNTFIPVLRYDGVYYSVSRGFEVPFKESPAGLEWDVSPSSMTGTTIGFEAESGTYYLAVFDSETANFTDGQYGNGQKEPMTRSEPPTGLLDPVAPLPRTNEDFLGWYQPMWFPYLRWELRREGDAYVTVYSEYDGTRPAWQPRTERYELKPLSDGLGFTGFEKGDDFRLVYNTNLRRFELTSRRTAGIRMPLARLQHAAAAEGAPMEPLARIGIPTWH